MNETVVILQDIQKHLQHQLKNTKVEIYPQNPKNWRFQNAGNAVLIGFNQANFANSIATDLMVQERTIELELIIIARSLHNELGALAVLDDVRQKIIGFKPVNAQPIAINSESFLLEEAGAWFYKLNIQTQTQQIQTIEIMEI